MAPTALSRQDQLDGKRTSHHRIMIMKTHIARYLLTPLLFFGIAVSISQAAEAEKPKSIMGSSKTDVDALLKDWAVRKSNRATSSRPIYYYTKDVSVIVYFRNDKADGVSVIDRPGAGVTSISQTRYDDLVKLIGQKPKPSDVKRDASGIHEFYVGNAE
jgi:hypothetical protein